MNLNNLFGKLRKKNRNHYKQIIFCVTLASLLVSCMFALILSPYIQKRLPLGGDSRKQIYMILGIALIGCFIFMIYAANIFLRYKSRELGVFMALGAQKGKLLRALITEIFLLAAACSLAGIVLGNAVSFLIGKGFEFIINSPEADSFALSFEGLAGAAVFSISGGVCMIGTASRFIRKNSLMDIINEQRKCEPVTKMVSSRYLAKGLAFISIGVLGGLIFPTVGGLLWKRNFGILPYGFYLFLIAGIYYILVFSVSVHKKGKNPGKYYKNLISYGMLKFQGASVVKNMLIITLLIAAALFAFFYSPTMYLQILVSQEQISDEFRYAYLENADMITKEGLDVLAKEYNLEIQDYRSVQFIRLLGSGMNRDNYDSNGKLIEFYQERMAYMEFISVSEYNQATGQDISVKKGGYKYISYKENRTNFWFLPEDLDRAENAYTGQVMPLSFEGVVIYDGLVRERGTDGNARYVINDEDYLELCQGLPPEMKVNQVLFNVNNKGQSYEFAKELYKEFCGSVSEQMRVIVSYDEYIESQNEEYDPFYSERVELYPDRPEVDTDWKFKPSFKVLEQKAAFLGFATFYLLFLFVAIISLAAAGIIGYTRSTVIAVKNKQVYDDIRKLGANHAYILRLLKSQIKKLYVLPTIIGVCVMFFYYFLMLWQNDRGISKSESLALWVDVIICILVCLFQYAGYWISMKKAEAII